MGFVKPVTLREQVEDYLRDSIVQGRLRPGERLREQEWCEQLRISRPTLREAMRTLEAERLVVIEPHRGPSVARMTRKEAEDLYALRALLEGYAAEQFAQHADDVMVTRLRQCVQELALQAQLADRSGLLRAKQDFYETLLEGCQNALVADILPGLLSRITLLRATSFSMAHRAPHSIREIEAVLRCIELRDAAGAREAARHHIDCARQAALHVLAQNDSEETGELVK